MKTRVVILLVLLCSCGLRKDIQIRREANQFLAQTQEQSAQLEQECTQLVCSAHSPQDLGAAEPVCDARVNRPGYIMGWYPVQYLEAKTMILVGLGKVQDAQVLHEQYLNATAIYDAQKQPGAPGISEVYAPYFSCFQAATNGFDVDCLKKAFCG